MCITCYGKKRYEDTVRVWCNVGSLTKLRGSGEGRVKCTGKKALHNT